MGNFTLKLLKNIKKMILRFTYVARGPERENKQCADILLTTFLVTLVEKFNFGYCPLN